MWQDDTKSIPLNSYLEAQDRFFNYFSTIPEVVGYGSFGSVKAPGLSDLDLVVVVEDDFLCSRKFFIPELEGDEKYIFTHAPLVVPISLLQILPYYHLINIEWAKTPDSITHEVDVLSTVGALHVLSKTLYLQSFLWRLIFNQNRPCRRSILAMTSVARSVQWLELFSLPVEDSSTEFVESILSLRTNWCSSPENRDVQIKALEQLLYDALKITLYLPEIIATSLLEFPGKNVQSTSKQRGMQYAPMNFILEHSIKNSDNMISNVLNKKSIFKSTQFLRKYQPFVVGNFSFSGPVAYSIFDLEYSIAERYRQSIGCCRWGGEVDTSLREITKEKLSDVLQKKYSANMEFAKSMNDSRLYKCNFGNVWMQPGFRGAVFRSLAKTMGRIRLVSRLNEY